MISKRSRDLFFIENQKSLQNVVLNMVLRPEKNRFIALPTRYYVMIFHIEMRVFFLLRALEKFVQLDLKTGWIESSCQFVVFFMMLTQVQIQQIQLDPVQPFAFGFYSKSTMKKNRPAVIGSIDFRSFSHHQNYFLLACKLIYSMQLVLTINIQVKLWQSDLVEISYGCLSKTYPKFLLKKAENSLPQVTPITILAVFYPKTIDSK